MIFFPFKLSINFPNPFGSIIKCGFTFLSFNIFFVLFLFAIKYIFFLSSNNKLQLGIGLCGLSYPLIFKSQATFSGAVINKKFDLFFFKFNN